MEKVFGYVLPLSRDGETIPDKALLVHLSNMQISDIEYCAEKLKYNNFALTLKSVCFETKGLSIFGLKAGFEEEGPDYIECDQEDWKDYVQRWQALTPRMTLHVNSDGVCWLEGADFKSWEITPEMMQKMK